MTGRIARTAGWLTGLAVVAVGLRLAATGDLASPPLTSVTALGDWADARTPAVAAIALARAGAEVAVWYLLVVSALQLATATSRSTTSGRVADALTVPALRRALHASVGLGLVAVSSTPAAATSVATGPAARAAAHDAVAAAPPAPDPPRGTASMRPQPAAHAPDATAGRARMVPVATTWTVTPGESLWTIAEEILADTWGRPPADGQVTPLWRALIEHNRDRLVDPEDPDLIHPGQVLEMPPVPSSPT